MKKTGSVFLAAVLLNLCCISHSQAALMTELVVDKAPLLAGTPATIKVISRQAADILAFGFNLEFDKTWVFHGAGVGPDFFDDSAIFSDTDVAGSIFPAISGESVVLATLTFTPSIPGLFDITVTSDLANPHQGLFALSGVFDLTTSMSVQVVTSPTATVPEPSSIFLISAGIVILFVSTRRRLSCRNKPR